MRVLVIATELFLARGFDAVTVTERGELTVTAARPAWSGSVRSEPHAWHVAVFQANAMAVLDGTPASTVAERRAHLDRAFDLLEHGLCDTV